MKGSIINVIGRRGISVQVGKVARDVLIADHDSPISKNVKIGHRLESSSRDSVTNQWLKKAMKGGKNVSFQSNAIIYLPIMLKTLQKLRSSDNKSVYFALLNKIKASDVTWILQNGRHIKSRDREGIPVELYHEISNMIYRMSLNFSKFTDSYALATFSLRLMDGYNELRSPNLDSRIPYETKFYKNCLLVVIKSESTTALSDAFDKLPSHQHGLKHLGKLAFYHQTGQFTRVMDALEAMIHSSSSTTTITREQIHAFSNRLSNLLQACLLSGEEEISQLFLKKLRKQWGYEIDDHSFAILKELSERLGMDQFLFSLTEGRKEIQPQITRKSMSWCEYINALHATGIDLFQKELRVDYSQVILSSVGPSLEDWKTFIDSNPLPHDAHDSLRAYYVTTILVELASRKSIGFVLSTLEFLVYERQFHRDIISSHKLMGFNKSSIFHALIKSISNSNSAKITAWTLHDFLKKRYQDTGFQFNINDYIYLMKSCAYRTDSFIFYYFLYHCLKDQRDALLTDQDFFEWHLPDQISLLLSQIKNPVLSRKVHEIEKNTKDLFTERTLNGLEVKDDDLQKLFGERQLSQKTSIKTLLPIVAAGDQLGRSMMNGRYVYYPSIDAEYAKRLSDCLNYILIDSYIRS